MEEGCVFISYARQQSYFAESLASHLQAAGIPVWIDIQQVRPGSNWAAEIRKGLASSRAMVLLASRKALDSSYVREEWTAAMAARKPVYVAFFEPVDLPSALRDDPRVSYFNFRRNFGKKVRQLSDCLKADGVHRDPVDAWRFLLLPPAHWVILASLLVPSLILLIWLVPVLAGGIYVPRPLERWALHEVVASANLVVIWAYVMVWGLVYAGAFLSRRFDVFGFRIAPWALLINVWFVYRALDAVTHGQTMFRVSDVPFSTIDFVYAFLALAGVAFASFWLQRRSADFLRWMPPGQAPVKMREALNAGVPKADAGPVYRRTTGEGKTYRIWHHEADETVAQEVAAHLLSAGFQPIRAGSAQPAAVAVFIVSNYVDLARLRQRAGELPERAVAVVATSIRMPDNPEEIFRFQWVDYRRRTPDQLSQLEHALTGTWTIQDSFAADPESMARMVLPKGIFFTANSLSALGAFALAAGLYLLTLPALGKTLSWQALPIVAVGLLMFSLAALLTERRIGERLFGAGYVVLAVAFLLLNVSGILWLVFRFYGANEYTGEPSVLGYVYEAVLLLVGPVVAVFFLQLIRRWLPRRRELALSTGPLQLHVPLSTLFLFSLAVLLITLMLLAATPL